VDTRDDRLARLTGDLLNTLARIAEKSARAFDVDRQAGWRSSNAT
jgi:hypothetical protein